MRRVRVVQGPRSRVVDAVNRPSCYGTTAKQSPEFRNHKCINCLYLLDCVEKETMMEKQIRPGCFGTQPKPDTVLWDERNCLKCDHLESCTHVTFGGSVILALRPSVILGTKLDQTKPRWSLLPSGTIAQVIAVLEFGAKKYAVNGWIEVPDAKTRYYDAAMRHLDAWHRGEVNDDESGLPHLAHAACCLLFLLWFDGKSVS